MMSIRDEEVRRLAETMMRQSGAPSLTAAIKLALQREIKRAAEAVPLTERVAAIRATALAKADRPAAPPLTEDERDTFWTR